MFLLLAAAMPLRCSHIVDIVERYDFSRAMPPRYADGASATIRFFITF